MDDYDAAVTASRSPLSVQPDVRALLRYATLAANGHNTQPWRFRVGEDRIDILPDFSRRTPVVDPDDHHLFASLGCAAEILSLAAAASGRPGMLAFDAANGGMIAFRMGRGVPVASKLCDAIPKRQSTRTDYDGRGVSTAELKLLAAAAAAPGVDLALITDRPQMDRVRDLVVAGNTAQMTDLAFMRKLKQWMRFNPHQALASRDGLFSATSGNPVLPTWAGPLMMDRFFNASSENDKYARQIRSSAGIAIFAGEVAALRPDLAALAGTPGRRPDIVMRFGYGPVLQFSARRSAEIAAARRPGSGQKPRNDRGDEPLVRRCAAGDAERRRQRQGDDRDDESRQRVRPERGAVIALAPGRDELRQEHERATLSGQ